jgi:hypothetical protein
MKLLYDRPKYVRPPIVSACQDVEAVVAHTPWWEVERNTRAKTKIIIRRVREKVFVCTTLEVLDQKNKTFRERLERW